MKWSGHEFKQPSPSSAEIRNGWKYTSTTPIYPLILDKKIITFYFFFIVKGIKRGKRSVYPKIYSLFIKVEEIRI
jgi:hypothetical protein